MNQRASFIMGAAIGGIIVLVVCWFFHTAHVASLKVHFDSDVARPTQVMLTDILATAESGNADLALTKLQKMEHLWRDYRDGSDTPELFVTRVTGIGNGPQGHKRADGSLPSR